MGSDSYGWIWNGLGSWELELDWNLTLTGTGPWLELELVSRIDGIGLVLDPGTGTYTAKSYRWDRTRLGSGNWNLTGTWPWLELDLDRNCNWWVESMGSDSSWYGNWNLYCWVGSMGSDSSWIRELELDWNLTLTGTGPWPELEPVSRIDGIGFVLDPETGTWLELDLDRNWNWWVGSMGSDSSWIRELELDWKLTLTGTGPWLELELEQ